MGRRHRDICEDTDRRGAREVTSSAPETAAVPADSDLPRPAKPWWKSRSALIAFGVFAVAAITVVTDLPLSSSPASNVASARSVVGEVAGDVAPCSYAVNESLRLYEDVRTGTLSKSDRSEVPGLVRQDYAACSLTDASIDDLAGIDEPNSPLGRDLNQIVSQTLNWCVPNAMRMIGDVSVLIERPRNVAEKIALTKSERELVREDALIEKSVSELKLFLATKSLPHLDLAKP